MPGRAHSVCARPFAFLFRPRPPSQPTCAACTASGQAGRRRGGEGRAQAVVGSRPQEATTTKTTTHLAMKKKTSAVGQCSDPARSRARLRFTPPAPRSCPPSTMSPPPTTDVFDFLRAQRDSLAEKLEVRAPCGERKKKQGRRGKSWLNAPVLCASPPRARVPLPTSLAPPTCVPGQAVAEHVECAGGGAPRRAAFWRGLAPLRRPMLPH